MLTYLSNYQDYKCHINDSFSSNHFVLSYRFNDHHFFKAFFKMIFLDVDSIVPVLQPLYSHTGRPAKFQIEILRSFILMFHFGYTSISKWTTSLKNDPALAILIGCHPNTTPACTNHYDFINRIFQFYSPEDIFPPNKNSKPKLKLKKNQKLPETKIKMNDVVDFYSSGFTDHDRPEVILQQLFQILAVNSSIAFNLINTNNDSGIIISGDGTAFHVHADSFGSKTKHLQISDSGPTNDPIYLRHYSDPDADIGWDSDLEVFYFGHTIYNISHHNPNLHIDLPLFLTFEKASRHDSITSISSFVHFSSINESFHPSFYCLDSASDNYPTHHFLLKNNVTPIIDVNKRNLGNNLYAPHIGISENGKPICQAGFEMAPHGSDYKRYRHKFRCPLKCGKVSSCDLSRSCSSSDYGRVIYIKFDTDIKLFGPVPYKSDKWISIYKNRTSCERINNRILNDYHLASSRTRGRNRLMFMTHMIGINIHLDALYKMTKS